MIIEQGSLPMKCQTEDRRQSRRNRPMITVKWLIQVSIQGVSIKCTLFYCLILKSHELLRHNTLFHTNPKACKFALIPHMMTSVACKQSYSRFSEQLDFVQLEDSIKFVPLKFYLCFVSMAVSHLPHILAHDFPDDFGGNAHRGTRWHLMQSFGGPFHSKVTWTGAGLIEACNRRKCFYRLFIEMECILLRFLTYVIGSSLAEIVKIENTRISN